jgi:hypothetical protein
MSTPPKADPAIYPRLREHMLTSKLPNFEPGALQKVLMDWHVANGTATVLAGTDSAGSTYDASVYLSSGGGFIGGGRSYPEVREAAARAIQLAKEEMHSFSKTETFGLPDREMVAFFITTGDGAYSIVAKEADLRNGTGPLAPLAAAMQAIITGYRMRHEKPPAKNVQ